MSLRQAAVDNMSMSSLEHAAFHIQQLLAVSAASIAKDQNQLTAAVCFSRVRLQAASKKLQDTKNAHTKVADAAAGAPNINIHDCASSARAQRDDLLSLAAQLQQLSLFISVIFAIKFFMWSPMFFQSFCVLAFMCSLSCARFHR
jgi:hypothetical protein